MGLYRPLVRPLLFRFDPETVHERVGAALRALARLPGGRAVLAALWGYRSPRLRLRLGEVEFPNPVGLAAGFDKTGALYPALAAMGFGSIECGTFTALPQAGNPRPRVVRLERERALVNRMGFNNPGAERAAATLARQRRTVPRGVSVGKGRAVPLAEAPQDHAAAIAHLARHGDYVAINVSSPNTPGLRALAAPEPLRAVLRAARAALVAAGAPACPLWLKLSPDLEPGELEGLVGLALDEGVAALILVNSTVRKDEVPAAAAEEGGLSGAPLRARALALLRQAHALCRGRLPLVGVGGIFTPADALARIRAGASLVQVYTGYVFEGPGLPRRINRHLDAVLRRERARLADLVGSEGAA